jgi:hypothetical protein
VLLERRAHGRQQPLVRSEIPRLRAIQRVLQVVFRALAFGAAESLFDDAAAFRAWDSERRDLLTRFGDPSAEQQRDLMASVNLLLQQPEGPLHERVQRRERGIALLIRQPVDVEPDLPTGARRRSGCGTCRGSRSRSWILWRRMIPTPAWRL